MSRVRNIFIAACVTLLSMGCAKNGSSNVNFIVNADSVHEGYSVPVRLFVKADTPGVFSFNAEVSRLNLLTGESEKVSRPLMHDMDELTQGCQVHIPDNGQMDFRIDGLDAGTYVIRVGLSSSSATGESSANFVVRDRNSGDIPPVRPDPDGRVFVSAFTLPVDEPDCAVDENGMMLLDIHSFSRENPYEFTSILTPDGAVNAGLVVMSDNPAVLRMDVIDGCKLVFMPGIPGVARVTVAVKDWSLVRTMSVRTFDDMQEGIRVKDLVIPDLRDPQDNRLVIAAPEKVSFTPTLVPSNASDRSFLVTSTNEKVAIGYPEDDGCITIEAVSPGYAEIRIYSEGGNGPSRVVPIRVTGEMNVRIYLEEDEPTQVQLETKTFPCNLMFESSSPFKLTTPVRFSVAVTCDVYKDYTDVKRVVDRRDVLFNGGITLYDIMGNVLIPAYKLNLSRDHLPRLQIAVTWDSNLDPAVWKLNVTEEWKTQTGLEINKYLVN